MLNPMGNSLSCCHEKKNELLSNVEKKEYLEQNLKRAFGSYAEATVTRASNKKNEQTAVHVKSTYYITIAHTYCSITAYKIKITFNRNHIVR